MKKIFSTPETAQTRGSTGQAHSRCAALDTLRGITVLSMVVYHAVWDLVFLFGMDWQWYLTPGADAWERSICCTFIALSGFCAAMGRHTIRRGVTVSLLGIAVTLVTLLFMPENRILFGVLTLIGACMLLVGILKKPLLSCPAVPGLAGSLLLFFVTYRITAGSIGIPGLKLQLPAIFYRNMVTAFFGFPPPGFWSTDYFPLLPWIFLFLGGAYLYCLAGRYILRIRWKGIAPLNFIGRHALAIYVIHQPVIYGILWLWFTITG